MSPDWDEITAMQLTNKDDRIAELSTEIRKLRAERDEARGDALALATERNNWQSMYQDAMAERDEALAALENERIKVAGCSTAAFGYWKEGDVLHADYECAAIHDVAALRAERDEARADALALATERNNWQSMYQDAMAERDEALALLREAREDTK